MVITSRLTKAEEQLEEQKTNQVADIGREFMNLSYKRQRLTRVADIQPNSRLSRNSKEEMPMMSRNRVGNQLDSRKTTGERKTTEETKKMIDNSRSRVNSVRNKNKQESNLLKI